MTFKKFTLLTNFPMKKQGHLLLYTQTLQFWTTKPKKKHLFFIINS